MSYYTVDVDSGGTLGKIKFIEEKIELGDVFPLEGKVYRVNYVLIAHPVGAAFGSEERYLRVTDLGAGRLVLPDVRVEARV
jgi:hypothetical protein